MRNDTLDGSLHLTRPRLLWLAVSLVAIAGSLAVLLLLVEPGTWAKHPGARALCVAGFAGGLILWLFRLLACLGFVRSGGRRAAAEAPPPYRHTSTDPPPAPPWSV